MPIKSFQLETPFDSSDKTKLDNIEAGAEANPSQVSSQEKTDGTEVELRSFSPKDIADMAGTHGGGGGGGGDADAIHDNVAGEINALIEKGSPASADVLIIEDSADSFNKKKVQVGNLPSGGSSLQRYQAFATVNEEVEVFATGAGITYSRAGTVGTFSIPNGVRLIGARLRLPMGTIGGFNFTVDFGTNGNNDGNTSFADMYPPTVQAWREDTGAQVAISTTVAPSSNFDRIDVSGLAGGQSNLVRLQW